MISIHLSQDLDRALRDKTADSRKNEEHASLYKLFAKYRVKPEPLFPEALGQSVKPIWQAACQGNEAKSIVERLLKIPGVEGAYINPTEALPGPE